MNGRFWIALVALGGAALATLAAPGAAQGPARFVPTPAFRAVVLGGPDDLRFVAGPRDGVLVRDGDAADDPAGLVRAGTLRVPAGHGPDLAAAVAPTLRAALVMGSGDLDVGPVAGPSFEGVVRGPGRLAVAALRTARAHLVSEGTGDVVVRSLDADTLVVEMHGPGDVRVTGTARSVSISVYGSGDCDARGLSTGDLVVVAMGAGNVQARSTRTARIAAGGSGDVVVNGHPHCAVRATGAGEVVCG